MDGFYIRGMEDFYMTGTLRYESMETYLESWNRGLNVETTPNGARVIMVQGSYLTKVAMEKPSILPSMLNNINLVDVRLDITPNNISDSIKVSRGDQF